MEKKMGTEEDKWKRGKGGVISSWNSFQIIGTTGTFCALAEYRDCSPLSAFLPLTAILKYLLCLVQEVSLFLFWLGVAVLCSQQTLCAVLMLPNASQTSSTECCVTLHTWPKGATSIICHLKLFSHYYYPGKSAVLQ